MDDPGYLSINLIWALLCLGFLVTGWITNIAGLPGNWIMVPVSALYSWLMPEASPYAFGWTIVVVLALLALAGEVLEFVTGAAGVGKAGGSRKGMIGSILGSIAGSFAGLIFGIPIPIVGSLVSALLFAGCGALAGAYAGEISDGKSKIEAWKVGKASFVSRIVGSLVKLAVGFAMLLTAAVAMAL